MSTTRLPDAFEPKTISDAPKPERLGAGDWADGYNSCLEATGAKELWEAGQALRASNRCHNGGDYPVSDCCEACTYNLKWDAVLAKPNPSNTVG